VGVKVRDLMLKLSDAGVALGYRLRMIRLVMGHVAAVRPAHHPHHHQRTGENDQQEENGSIALPPMFVGSRVSASLGLQRKRTRTRIGVPRDTV
jgi:hypothetical protein